MIWSSILVYISIPHTWRMIYKHSFMQQQITSHSNCYYTCNKTLIIRYTKAGLSPLSTSKWFHLPGAILNRLEFFKANRWIKRRCMKRDSRNWTYTGISVWRWSRNCFNVLYRDNKETTCNDLFPWRSC